jgi:hypothetical protein
VHCSLLGKHNGIQLVLVAANAHQQRFSALCFSNAGVSSCLTAGSALPLRLHRLLLLLLPPAY